MKAKHIMALLGAALMAAALTACARESGEVPSAPQAPASATDAGESADGAAPAAEYHKITAEEAKERLDANPDAVIVDVRTPEEHAAERIEGSINVPNESIRDEQPALLPDLDAEILVHCRTGVRSRQAAEKLVALGYTNVYDFGGIVDWPYGTVTGE